MRAMQDSHFRPALADVLLAAARCVADVRAGRSLTDALAGVTPALRPAAQAVAFHVMRRLGTAMALRDLLLARRPPGALPDALLLAALALLDTAAGHAAGPEAAAASRGAGAADGGSGGPNGADDAGRPGLDGPGAPAQPGVPLYAPHTVVDQAVRAAAGQKKLQPYKGLINAALRRYLRERDRLLAQLQDDAQATWNHPPWWVQRLRAAYPDDWQAVLRVSDRPPPLTLRVNRRRARREQVQDAFAQAGIGARPVLEDGLVLAEPRPVAQLPGYGQGWWSVQDAGAQLAAPLLPLLPLRGGMRVLDACAAPGGKAAHMLERADIELLALDADAARLERVGGNLARLGLDGPHAVLRAGDAADPGSWWDGRPFDAVLADVPCTASGIVRRHPDIRWLRRPADVPQAAARQRAIVDALWGTVAAGGHLLYATCSVFPEEGERQAQAFLRRHPEAARLPAPGQLLPADGGAPGQYAHDGFFYALFAKPH